MTTEYFIIFHVALSVLCLVKTNTWIRNVGNLEITNFTGL